MALLFHVLEEVLIHIGWGNYIMKNLFLLLSLFIASFSLAVDYAVQDNIKNEFGNCYKVFPNNLESCTLSTCAYPDLYDSKAWKAQVIRGYAEDQKCYVVYYSYIDNRIIGSPDHCFYDQDQMRVLTNLYRTLFSSYEVITITDVRQRMISLNYDACKKESEIKKSALQSPKPN